MTEKHEKTSEHAAHVHAHAHNHNDEHNIENEATKKRRSFKIKLNPALYFISIAAALLFGYLVGAYHKQAEVYIGSIFGGNANSATIDLSSLEETYFELATNYDGKLDVDKLITGANRGLVEAVNDTYTTYMSADEAAEYSDSLEGNIGGGIGAVIGMKNDNITIMSILDDNPAVEAGLRAGDTVLEINDMPTDGLTVDQAVAKIRGEAGTTVKLLINRNGQDTIFNITRAIINNPSVISEVEDGIGIMTISRFDESTGSLARVAAQGFIKDGVKAVILDLRNNPGGYVDAAVDVVSLWLDNQIVVTERKDGRVVDTIRSGSNPVLEGVNTAILVNGASASASEIVSGALQDYGAAKIVGEQTFGKGSVQQLITLDLGAQLKVTIAKWYTPKGRNINSQGITPDTAVSLTQDDVDNDRDPQLDKAIELLGL